MTYRLRKFVCRRRKSVLAAVLMLLALVGGLVGTTWGLIRATHAEADAVNQAKEKDRALREEAVASAAAQESERKAKDQLFRALVSEAHARRTGGQGGQRWDSLESLAKAVAIARERQYGEEK